MVDMALFLLVVSGWPGQAVLNLIWKLGQWKLNRNIQRRQKENK